MRKILSLILHFKGSGDYLLIANPNPKWLPNVSGKNVLVFKGTRKKE
jgi:hypothetical protein